MRGHCMWSFLRDQTRIGKRSGKKYIYVYTSIMIANKNQNVYRITAVRRKRTEND